MLLSEIENIIALSYSELGDIGYRITQNFNKGYGVSQKQKALIKKLRLVQMELKIVLDHVVYDEDGHVTRTIRTTDEQLNKSLTYLIDLTEIQDYSVAPLLFFKGRPKRLYIDDSTKVSKSGDTMTGPLSIPAGTVPAHAVNKSQLDQKVSKAGDSMTGALAMGNNKVTGVGNGTDPTDAVNRSQLDQKVSKAGDSMTGPLAMGLQKITGLGNGTDPNDAVNKGQLDAAASSAQAYADGLVTGLWDDRGSFDASGGAYPNTGGSGIAGAIRKGDIWTVSVAGTLPTAQVVEPGDTVRALIDSPGNTQANWSIQQNNIGYVPLNKAGDTLLGNINANGNKITNLPAATNPGEAVRFEQLPTPPTISGTPNLLYKLVDIGSWDMDTVAAKTVAHGIADYTKIVKCEAYVVRDGGGVVYPLVSVDGAFGNLEGIISAWDATNVYLSRRTGGGFDSTFFNSPSGSRGKIFIIYEA